MTFTGQFLQAGNSSTELAFLSSERPAVFVQCVPSQEQQSITN